MIYQMRSGPSFTAEIDGVVLGCAGLVLPWPGVGVVWMCLAKEVAPYRLWLTRTTRRILDDLIRAYALHRVEVVALQESDRNLQWLRLLGFSQERDGLARAYFTDKRSVVRFERIERADHGV